jgi:hypothetical protein
MYFLVSLDKGFFLVFVQYMLHLFYSHELGDRGSVVGLGTILQDRRSQVRLPMSLLDFSINLSFQSHYDCGFD